MTEEVAERIKEAFKEDDGKVNTGFIDGEKYFVPVRLIEKHHILMNGNGDDLFNGVLLNGQVPMEDLIMMAVYNKGHNDLARKVFRGAEDTGYHISSYTFDSLDPESTKYLLCEYHADTNSFVDPVSGIEFGYFSYDIPDSSKWVTQTYTLESYLKCLEDATNRPLYINGYDDGLDIVIYDAQSRSEHQSDIANEELKSVLLQQELLAKDKLMQQVAITEQIDEVVANFLNKYGKQNMKHVSRRF